MKASLRAVMAAVFAGGVVYLLWKEEDHSRRREMDEIRRNDTIAKMRAAIQAQYRESDTSPSLLEAMEGLKQSQQALKDTLDESAVASGHPELAFDPVSAKFRLAIQERTRKK